jgi:5-methylcytosine-specific restriction endonuclease McrA
VLIKNIKDVIQGKATFKCTRSKHWPKIRKKHLLDNPKCVVCEEEKQIEVHHIKPFHEFPELELEPTNLVTLCESKKFGIVCHLLVGHLGSYKKINPDVLNDAKIWNSKLNK